MQSSEECTSEGGLLVLQLVHTFTVTELKKFGKCLQLTLYFQRFSGYVEPNSLFAYDHNT